MEPRTEQVDITVPGGLSDVEKLIQDLYRPGSSQEIAKIQETLQQLQRSPRGWQLANSLLESHDETVKFFGALTFTVKLNLDSDTLSDEDAALLLRKIITWLILCLDEGVGPLVIRKLCSTLVVYFLHFSASWTMCIKHIIFCLAVNEAVSTNAIENAPETTMLMRSLGTGKALAVLWFSTALAEEVGKTDANNIKFHNFHDRLEANATDVVALITSGLDASAEASPSILRQNSMRCFHAWVLYSHRAFVDVGISLEDLKVLTKPAMACLVQEDMCEVTIELFSDILGNYSKFFKDSDFQLLSQLLNSEWSRERYTRLVRGDYEFDSLQYGQFLIAFGDATVEDLARTRTSESQDILSALEGLLHAEGYAVAEDHIFVQALEFWSTFVEVMVDSLYSEEEDVVSIRDSLVADTEVSGPDSPWFVRARSHVVRVMEYCWAKIQFPPPEVFDEWDFVDKTGFGDARKDVADLLQSSYTLIGSSLFSLFATLAVNALERRAWAPLEASLFCVGTLADCVDDDPAYEDILTNLFGSRLFTILADPATLIPARTRQTTLSLIAQYDGYFEKHKDHLAAALTFLFKALESAILAPTASRSILSLCSSCRQVLTPELNVFLQHYAGLTAMRSIEGLVKERIMGSIAAIIQAVPRNEDQIEPLSKLLRYVQSDLEKCLELSSRDLTEEAALQGLEALRCLASIAKGLQAPADIPIELDNTTSVELTNSYWITGEGSAVQRSTRDIIIQLIQTFPNTGDLIEAACGVFRAGFAETTPGPLVFSPDTVVEFLLKFSPQTPRLGAVMSTACSLISSHAPTSPKDIEMPLRNLLTWDLAILQNLEEPANDPEIAQVGIDFIHRSLTRHIHMLLDQPSVLLEYFFMFSLKAITGRDPLPKAAAADFWSSFVSETSLIEPIQARLNMSMEQVGPFLAQALIYNVSGNAARSELDKIAEPLKRLVARQVRAKSWLENALFHLTDQDNKASENERRIFLQKLIK
ncbi:MAG: hypothetical protein M1818_000288 [Claussenomyces sp. TS43310]|nr:MAG: hypothetical protein M1818_000288 [Claussenomyces sp. TS43310]